MFFNKDKKKWHNLMVVNKLEGFTLVKKEYTEYGAILTISIPPSSSFEEFEKKKDRFTAWFKGIVELTQIPFTRLMTMTIINKDIGDYPFVPVKAPQNKIWISKDVMGRDVFTNLDQEAHFLYGGINGSGKTFSEAIMLANLIATKGDDIEVHLSQIVKGEVGRFAKCKCVKSVNMTVDEVRLKLDHICKVVDERSLLMTKLGLNNLTHYVKKTGKKMKRIFFVIEEVSFFMPSDGDSDEVAKSKSQCWDKILKLVKAGRSCGVHFISVTQRSTVTNIPSDVKSQMCCITMRQRSKIDSLNIVECDEATTLRSKEALMWGKDGLMRLKYPTIDEDFMALKKYVPEIIVYEGEEKAENPSKMVIEQVKFEHIPIKNDEKVPKIEQKQPKTTKKKKKGVNFSDYLE